MGKHRLENNIQKLFKRDLDRDIDYTRVSYRSSIYDYLNEGIELKSFNRQVLKNDLMIIKNKLKDKKLNKRLLSYLNKYFDDICCMAGYNSEIFKEFFRQLIE